MTAVATPQEQTAAPPTGSAEPPASMPERVDYLAAYKERCAKEGCRCNSAVIAMLKAQPHRPLQQLPLANNYVGPRGFLAVMHLVEQCQTIEMLDLRGNGLDNHAVQLLCHVLQRHLGVSRVHLDSNPIALDAGHALMKLLQTNRNIVECTVAHTDVPPGICDRIAMAAAENHEHVTGKKPAMLPSRPLALRPSSSPGLGTAGSSETPARGGAAVRAARLGSASTQPPAAESPAQSPSERASVPTVSAPDTTTPRAGYGGATMSPRFGRPPAGPGAGSPQKTPTLTTAKPKPPGPAIASDFHARLTPDHRRELRERYRRRAAQYQAEAAKTESSRAAAVARTELQALEAAQQRVQAERETEAAKRVPRSLPELRMTPNGQKSAAADADESNLHSNTSRDHPSRPRNRGSRRQRTGNSPDQTIDEATPDRDSPGAGADEPAASKPKAARFVIDGETTAPERAPRQTKPEDKPSASMHADFELVAESDIATAATGDAAPPNTDNNNNASAAAPMNALVVAEEDQFKVLFNLGCRQYNEHNLDAAYKAWTDALELATAQHNREWMSLLTENLQALSYEVLMAETTKHVDDGALDDAERTLALAERIATRARNAAWISEVAKVRQRVLRGQFQRHHERAQERYEALQQYHAVQVTDDDRYEEDGVLMRHSALYVNEWARMLLVKEAVEGWCEAYQRGNEVGGQQGRAMREVVDTAVGALCSLLLERYYTFEHETPSTLTSFHTWGLIETERDKLVELWRDICSKAKVLQNPRWELLQAGQLGNLLLASHDLSSAIQQFTTMGDRAEAIGDRYLLAAARYFCGTAQLQRASYADAETHLRFAVELLNDLRRDLPDPAKPAAQPAAPSPTGDISLPASADYGDRLSPNLPTSAAGERPHSSAESADNGEGGRLTWPTQRMAANLHHRLYYLRSRCFACAFKFTDALEMHERALVNAHCDVLYEKMTKNFNQPTRDHIACVAATMQAPLVYFATHYRHEWDSDADMYAILEHLYVWVVPADGPAKFTLIDVHKDHRVKTILHVIDRARKAISVQTNSEDTTTDLVSFSGVDPDARQTRRPEEQDVGASQADSDVANAASPAAPKDRGVRLEPPEVQWREPLRELYRVLMHTVVDTVAAFSQYTNQNGFVVIPYGFLWLVPFAALIDPDDHFLVENFTITHGLSATQLASSALAWKSACSSATERRLIVSQPEAQPSSIEPHLAFLTDSYRAETEAAAIAELISGEVITGTATDAEKIPAALPRSRWVHICTPVLSDCARNSMTGGIAATTSYDQLGILHATDVAFFRSRAEMVVHTNVNVARDACMAAANEGSLGWMRALLGCGTACCVFPLWCTPDMAPVDFATTFYENVRNSGGHKARAVANTMRQFIDAAHTPAANPRIWAPYVVLGFPAGLERRPATGDRPASRPTSNTPAAGERRPGVPTSPESGR